MPIKKKTIINGITDLVFSHHRHLRINSIITTEYLDNHLPQNEKEIYKSLKEKENKISKFTDLLSWDNFFYTFLEIQNQWIFTHFRYLAERNSKFRSDFLHFCCL